MANENDISIEYSRTLQLLEQFNLQGKREFTIVFGAIDEDADYSTWSISKHEYIEFRESGFVHLMLHLLSAFLEYKSQTIPIINCHGIIQISRSDISIEWVNEEVANNAISKIKDSENDLY